MSIFMPHRTPLENQLQAFANGGSPMPSPTAIMPPPQADPQNPPPIGSTPSNVADDIDAKLSEGEFVLPADVVKFYGVDYFHKLITKAKEGMLKMAESGLIKGNGPPVAHVPRDENGDPQEGAPPAEGAKAGGFFAPFGHPEYSAPVRNANGGYQSYAGGGLAAVPHTPHILTGLPGGLSPSISGMIPHNTGIIHSGVRGPIRNGTAFTHATMNAPHVKMNSGGFMGTDMSTNDYSAGGMPGGMMTPYNAPTAPMTAQPDTSGQMPRQYPQAAYQGMMQPYS